MVFDMFTKEAVDVGPMSTAAAYEIACRGNKVYVPHKRAEDAIVKDINIVRKNDGAKLKLDASIKTHGDLVGHLYLMGTILYQSGRSQLIVILYPSSDNRVKVQDVDTTTATTNDATSTAYKSQKIYYPEDWKVDMNINIIVNGEKLILDGDITFNGYLMGPPMIGLKKVPVSRFGTGAMIELQDGLHTTNPADARPYCIENAFWYRSDMEGESVDGINILVDGVKLDFHESIKTYRDIYLSSRHTQLYLLDNTLYKSNWLAKDATKEFKIFCPSERPVTHITVMEPSDNKKLAIKAGVTDEWIIWYPEVWSPNDVHDFNIFINGEKLNFDDSIRTYGDISDVVYLHRNTLFPTKDAANAAAAVEEEAAQREAKGEDAQSQTQEGAQRQTQEDAQMQPQEDAQRKAQEDAQRKTQEKAQEDAQRKTQEKAQEDAQRKAQQKAKEDAQRKADAAQRQANAVKEEKAWAAHRKTVSDGKSLVSVVTLVVYK
eukprot:GHVS01034612.1.p1 GENE.GHVS01034612.1~~GHVS01034612.1.p1  ORF type:complete len:489 (-),score=72.10 GHVS01034612.1:356-1822(-)